MPVFHTNTFEGGSSCRMWRQPLSQPRWPLPPRQQLVTVGDRSSSGGHSCDTGSSLISFDE